MFLIFILLKLKIHTNSDYIVHGTNKVIKEINNFDIKPKTKEIIIHKCDVIKSPYDSEKKFQEANAEYDHIQYINCSNEKYNEKLNKVEFEGVTMNNIGKHTFEQNSDAMIIIKNADFQSRRNIILAQATINSKAQIIRITGEGKHIIMNTKFKIGGQNHRRYLKSHENLLKELDPTIIIFEDCSHNLISDSQFSAREKENSKLFEHFPTRCIRTFKTCNLIVNQTYFYNATSYHQGSFFHLNSKGEISILNSYFESCYDQENIAHAILAKQGIINIKNCNFNNILMNQASKGSIILSETEIFNFEGNDIKFDHNPIINSRCLYLSNEGTFNISLNKFHNFESNEKGGLIFNSNPSDIIFNNNEFNCMKGNKLNHSIYLTINSFLSQKFIGNKFHNISSADGFFHIKSIDDIEFNATFENMDLESIYLDGGSIVDVENENNLSYGIVFKHCNFQDNNNTNGGSILINQETHPYCIALYAFTCDFHFNDTPGKGGAIAFYNNGDIFIENGNVNVNSASEGGGAIYIELYSHYTGKCSILNTNFNRNGGNENSCIWVNSISFDDDYILEISNTLLADCFGNYKYETDSCFPIVSNCKINNIYDCIFQCDDIGYYGEINITAKSILNIQNCQFKSHTGKNGGICYNYREFDELDRSREEYISIKDCVFDIDQYQDYNNKNALFLNVLTFDVYISNCDIINHVESNYIFYILFNFETNEIFTLKNVSFIRNSYTSEESGIYIAQKITQEHSKSLTVKFDECTFEYNSSPTSGGAINYDFDENLKEVDLIFKDCSFKHNLCQGSGGACHFSTKKTVEFLNCDFNNNTCKSEEPNSGGGSLDFSSSVEFATVFQCNFSNCEAPKGSFIYSNGGVKGFNISRCVFNNLDNHQSDCVYLKIDSSITMFIFELNDFIDLKCEGDFGGSGLYIGTGCDCEVTSCKFNGNSGEGQIVIAERSENKLNFVKCEFEQGSDGSRMFYIKEEALINFETCIFHDFNNLSESSGRSILVYSLCEEKNSIFDNCTFTDINSYSTMDFDFCKKIEINFCNFSNVKVIRPGGLMFISKALEFKLTNCLLYESGSPNGLYDNSCFELCPTVETAEIINCTFDFCGRCRHGAAVYTKNISKIEIVNCEFLRNMASGQDGDALSIYVGEGSKECIISYCKIHQRKTSYNNVFQFRVFSSKVILTNNIFDKYNPDDISLVDAGVGGIYLSEIKSMDMFNNIFSTRNTAVFISNIEQINVLNNTWQECYGEKGTSVRAIYVKSTLDSIIFYNNTIKDFPDVKNSIMSFTAKMLL